jgi:hypothetical protein
MQSGKLSFPLTRSAFGSFTRSDDPVQIDRGISGPGRIKERSKSAYLAFFLNGLLSRRQFRGLIEGAVDFLATGNWGKIAPDYSVSEFGERSFPIPQYAK